MSQNVETAGADNLKLIIAGILFLGTCFTIVGILPIAILLIGAALAYKGGDVSNVRTTTRFVQALLVVAALTAWGAALYFYAENSRIAAEGGYISSTDEELPIVLPIFGMVSFGIVWLLEAIWHAPFKRLLQRRKLLSQEPATRTPGVPNIMAREGLAPYSTADELLKWKRLRDEGLVTDEEFSEARTKIMSGR